MLPSHLVHNTVGSIADLLVHVEVTHARSHRLGWLLHQVLLVDVPLGNLHALDPVGCGLLQDWSVGEARGTFLHLVWLCIVCALAVTGLTLIVIPLINMRIFGGLDWVSFRGG